MVESEISVLSKQCLNRRIATKTKLTREVNGAKINWMLISRTPAGSSAGPTLRTTRLEFGLRPERSISFPVPRY